MEAAHQIRTGEFFKVKINTETEMSLLSSIQLTILISLKHEQSKNEADYLPNYEQTRPNFDLSN